MSVYRALEDLREQRAALEAEIARLEREQTARWARNQPIEERAMEAIRAGDDRSAKMALEQLQAAEADSLLDADLTVLRALADECRDFLATVDQVASSE